jgi:hypothetical protein
VKKSSPKDDWDYDHMTKWLVQNGLSPRVARDQVSRCRRIEEALSISLVKQTANEAAFRQLMIALQKYSVSVSEDIPQARTLTGSLRLAARKFANYQHGEKAALYPASHKLTSYI